RHAVSAAILMACRFGLTDAPKRRTTPVDNRRIPSRSGDTGMAAGDLDAAPRRPHGGPRRSFFPAMVAAIAGAGCLSPGKPLIESPVSFSKQQQAVLDVVPKGTSRGEAEKRLRAAGIEFTPGGNGSIYYLSLWNRRDGTRWHISVALLFDSAGKLYESR